MKADVDASMPRLETRFTLRPMAPEAIDKLPASHPFRKLAPDERKTLLTQERELIEHLAKDPASASRFVLDPLATARALVPKADVLLRAFAELHARAGKAKPDLGPVVVTHASVKVTNETRHYKTPPHSKKEH